MNDSSASVDQYSEEVTALRQRLLDLEQSNRQYQQQIEELTQQLTEVKAAQLPPTETDLSDRQRVEAELRESEQRLQLAQQAGRMGAWDWNLQTNEVSWSDGMWTILGLEPNSIIPNVQSFTPFIHPDDREQAFRKVEIDLAQGDHYDGEFRVLRQDGMVCWFLSKGQVIRTPEGQPQRLLGINVDITERKQAEAALRQSEERYRSLAELIPQLVWTADAAGVLIDVNQRWSIYTGLTLAEVQKGGWELVVHPEDIPVLAHQWAIAQHSGTYQAEGRMRRADGVHRWHLHQAIPLKNEQGELIKWFGTATDIEDQKQLEQQRSQLLQQAQAAREQAETANRIKDEFLAVLSHELRTPLSPILGWAKLLRTSQFDPPAAHRALATIERNAELQAQLIEDLLDVSRILQGKMRLNASPVHLGRVIEAALETVRLSAEAKEIQIQTILAPDVGLVNGDANRLQQVLWNLLSNAVKFTPSGGAVEVRLEPIDSYAQIQVSDTGQGIGFDFLPHVFEYFRQADSTTTRQVGGLGLGLAIVRHLVELHGGTIHAESQGEGLGATFTVRLPLMSAPPPEAPEPPALAPALNLNGMQILVVDDVPDTLEFVAFVLEEAGAQVLTATSGTAALTTLTQAQPDLLLSDIGMSHMDGYMLIRQVRDLPANQGGNTPAIALTAFAGEMNQQQALEAGFQMHLPKPIDPEHLIATIAQLGIRGARQES